MDITKEDFERYEAVRIGGRTNMLMISNVCSLSGLDKDQVKEIILNYGKYTKQYPDVRKG
ncbi:hypothetical protein LCGC14_1891300 [marine sediment metagenome]|uniref:Uncharacterized protein n=1 Tax=marine sediment metagenome TaxID=412755 RepID=A0A0F9IDB1_9ZZZZ